MALILKLHKISICERLELTHFVWYGCDLWNIISVKGRLNSQEFNVISQWFSLPLAIRSCCSADFYQLIVVGKKWLLASNFICKRISAAYLLAFPRRLTCKEILSGRNFDEWNEPDLFDGSKERNPECASMWNAQTLVNNPANKNSIMCISLWKVKGQRTTAQEVTSECVAGTGHAQHDESGRLPLTSHWLRPPRTHWTSWTQMRQISSILFLHHIELHRTQVEPSSCDVFEHTSGDYRMRWCNTWNTEKVRFIMVPWGTSTLGKCIKVLHWYL